MATICSLSKSIQLSHDPARKLCLPFSCMISSGLKGRRLPWAIMLPIHELPVWEMTGPWWYRLIFINWVQAIDQSYTCKVTCARCCSSNSASSGWITLAMSIYALLTETPNSDMYASGKDGSILYHIMFVHRADHNIFTHAGLTLTR